MNISQVGMPGFTPLVAFDGHSYPQMPDAHPHPAFAQRYPHESPRHFSNQRSFNRHQRKPSQPKQAGQATSFRQKQRLLRSPPKTSFQLPSSLGDDATPSSETQRHDTEKLYSPEARVALPTHSAESVAKRQPKLESTNSPPKMTRDGTDSDKEFKISLGIEQQGLDHKQQVTRDDGTQSQQITSHLSMKDAPNQGHTGQTKSGSQAKPQEMSKDKGLATEDSNLETAISEPSSTPQGMNLGQEKDRSFLMDSKAESRVPADTPQAQSLKKPREPQMGDRQGLELSGENKSDARPSDVLYSQALARKEPLKRTDDGAVASPTKLTENEALRRNEPSRRLPVPSDLRQSRKGPPASYSSSPKATTGRDTRSGERVATACSADTRPAGAKPTESYIGFSPVKDKMKSTPMDKASPDKGSRKSQTHAKSSSHGSLSKLEDARRPSNRFDALAQDDDEHGEVDDNVERDTPLSDMAAASPEPEMIQLQKNASHAANDGSEPKTLAKKKKSKKKAKKKKPSATGSVALESVKASESKGPALGEQQRTEDAVSRSPAKTSLPAREPSELPVLKPLTRPKLTGVTFAKPTEEVDTGRGSPDAQGHESVTSGYRANRGGSLRTPRQRSKPEFVNGLPKNPYNNIWGWSKAKAPTRPVLSRDFFERPFLENDRTKEDKVESAVGDGVAANPSRSPSKSPSRLAVKPQATQSPISREKTDSGTNEDSPMPSIDHYPGTAREGEVLESDQHSRGRSRHDIVPGSSSSVAFDEGERRGLTS